MLANIEEIRKQNKKEKIETTFMNTFIVQVKFTDHISLYPYILIYLSTMFMKEFQLHGYSC